MVKLKNNKKQNKRNNRKNLNKYHNHNLLLLKINHKNDCIPYIFTHKKLTIQYLLISCILYLIITVSYLFKFDKYLLEVVFSTFMVSLKLYYVLYQ